MFELQDSKGNRFALSRGAQKKRNSQSNAGSSLQIKRLLRYCDTVTLVRAYSYFFAGQKASIKPLAAKASDSNNDQTVVFETRILDENSSPTGLPVAQRASAQRFSREQKLFSAIANGELQLEQTHTAQAFDIAKAEKALNLSRSRLLSELNAIAINEHAAAQKNSAPKQSPLHWGASSHNPTTKSTPKALTIQQHYHRFVTSLPQVVKADGAGIVSAPTGNSEIQSKELIKALGFSTTKVSTGQFQHALQLVSAIWRDKGLYKTLTQFSNAYATAHEPSASVERSRLSNNSKVSDTTHFELALTLLLSHNQEPHSLSSPSARQIELFPRFKQAGRNLWETADTSKTIAAERKTNAGKASFSDLATEEAPARERTSPLTYIEIQLLDDKGEPVANEAYWIRDTEGNEHTGSTDGSGKARVDSIKSGSCLVAFPDIEGSGVHKCSTEVDCCTPPPPVLTFVEIKLVDDAGEPVADEDYLIICPQGTEYEGTTDAAGIARVEDIIEGACKVSFPNYSPDAVQMCDSGADCCKPEKSKSKADDNEGATNRPENDADAAGATSAPTGTQSPVTAGAADTTNNPAGAPIVAPAPSLPTPPSLADTREPDDKCWLEVMVHNGQNIVLPNLSVAVIDADGQSHQATTDTDGKITLPTIAAGQCTVSLPSAPAWQAVIEKSHTVAQGDTLSKLARAAGLENIHVIYDAPQNAEFKKLRPNPNLIYPGDQVVIPQRSAKTTELPSGQMHALEAPLAPPDTLELTLKNESGKILRNRALTLILGNQEHRLTTSATGNIKLTLEDGMPDSGEMQIYDEQGQNIQNTITLQFGHLDPVTALSGVQARCNALGFDCGTVDGQNGPKTRAGIKAFQQAHGLQVDGIPGPKTQAKLTDVYGS